VTKPEPSEFGPAVLRSLPTLVPVGMTEADLALELGLSAHLQMSGTEVDDAIAQMWAIRQAILEASGLDASIEPIPIGGRSQRLGLLNLTIYLGHLVERAAALQDCDRDSVVTTALGRPVIGQIRRAAADVRQLRSS
jgi:hypothetical protein